MCIIPPTLVLGPLKPESRYISIKEKAQSTKKKKDALITFAMFPFKNATLDSCILRRYSPFALRFSMETPPCCCCCLVYCLMVSICDTVVIVVPLEMEQVSESARIRGLAVVETEKEAELLLWEPPLKQVVQGQTGVFVRGGGGAQWRANQFRAAEGMMTGGGGRDVNVYTRFQRVDG